MESELEFSQISLSLIVPVYNEEASIVSALHTNISVLEKYVKDCEILVVNDGSTDNSQKLIESVSIDKEFIQSFQKKNEGFGSAVRLGISKSKFDYVLPVPVDSPLDDETLLKFISHIEQNDIVVGYRYKREGYSLRMKLVSFVFHHLISMLFKIEMRDYNWIHIYRRSIFEEYDIEITSNGILMLAEVLIKADRKQLKIEEVGVHQKARLTGTATASRPITIYHTVLEIIRLYEELQ